jgi:hypothetical protein
VAVVYAPCFFVGKTALTERCVNGRLLSGLALAVRIDVAPIERRSTSVEGGSGRNREYGREGTRFIQGITVNAIQIK